MPMSAEARLEEFGIMNGSASSWQAGVTIGHAPISPGAGNRH
jgi:hypothetical protein